MGYQSQNQEYVEIYPWQKKTAEYSRANSPVRGLLLGVNKRCNIVIIYSQKHFP